MGSSFRKPVKILRISGGHYDDDGYWHDGEAEEITVRASVQPLNRAEANEYADMLSNGAFTTNAIKLYLDEPLIFAKQAGENGRKMREADIVLWRDRRWKVIACFDWQSGVISHFKAIAQEVEPDEGSDAEIPA